jgi:anti-sigma regulatory factor (Ser/Thr protein kinase)
MNTLSTSLSRSPDSVGAARRLLNGHTTSLGAQQRQEAALMVSELVTNAVVHGVGAISLRIDVEADAVRVEVADEGSVAVAPRPEPGAHGGWGLRIVAQLADDWGVLEGSTKVWFRLRRPSDSARTARPVAATPEAPFAR